MKILVTGGAGFIGSHLCERLLQDGRRVFVIDDLNDFYPPAWKHDNLARLRNAGLSRFDECDIRDAQRVARIVSDIRPEAVIHLAARAGVRPSLAQPFLYEEVNVRGTLALLEASRGAGVRKFLFASSSSIYGLANTIPFREDDYRNLPVSPYAATKLAGEKLCFTYSHLYRLPVVCLRFFTVYGPRQRPDLAIYKFTDLIETGQAINVFGDGSSGRDYTHIRDIVQGILAALEYDCSYEIFNLGSSRPILLTDLVSALERALERKAAIHWLPDQPGDVQRTFADIGKAHALLGYEPRAPFEEGIRTFVDWYRAERACQDASSGPRPHICRPQ